MGERGAPGPPRPVTLSGPFAQGGQGWTACSTVQSQDPPNERVKAASQLLGCRASLPRDDPLCGNQPIPWPLTDESLMAVGPIRCEAHRLQPGPGSASWRCRVSGAVGSPGPHLAPFLGHRWGFWVKALSPLISGQPRGKGTVRQPREPPWGLIWERVFGDRIRLRTLT